MLAKVAEPTDWRGAKRAVGDKIAPTPEIEGERIRYNDKAHLGGPRPVS
jgi:hypothetical protein